MPFLGLCRRPALPPTSFSYSRVPHALRRPFRTDWGWLRDTVDLFDPFIDLDTHLFRHSSQTNYLSGKQQCCCPCRYSKNTTATIGTSVRRLESIPCLLAASTMLSSRLPPLANRRLACSTAAVFTLVLVVLTLRSLSSYTTSTIIAGHGPSQWPISGFNGGYNTDGNKDDNNNAGANIENLPTSSLAVPADTSSWKLPDIYYTHTTHNQPSTCEQRFGPAYLEELRHTRATYCSADSPSQLTCFHNNNGADNKGGRTDSFCIAQGAVFNQATKKFQVACDTLAEPWGVEKNESSLKLQSFGRYWYDTGPRIVMDRALSLVAPKQERDAEISPASLSASSPPPPPPPGKKENFTILLKREGELNPWHCLLEIISLTFSIDVLRMTPQQQDETAEAAEMAPFWTLADAENTQVVILDDRLDGPYFDLWQLFAKKPIVRIGDLESPPSSNNEMGNVIIPLPGASNPLWQGDWETHPCRHSVLLQTFAWRVLRYYDIPDTLEEYGDNSSSGDDVASNEDKDKVVVTFIDRRGQRKLVDMDSHIAALRDRYENEQQHVVIHVVDLAALSFPEQIKLVRNSDVLAGVHGAGLTHGLWMKEHSTMVEILPEDLNHKGFRNFAGVLGHDYFSTHGSKVADNSGNWQHDDVSIDGERFLEVMDFAIKSMYNKGRLNYDVN